MHRGDVGMAKEQLARRASGDAGAGRQAGKGRFWEQPHRGKLQDTLERFNAKAEENKKKSERNPFSDAYVRPEHKPTDEQYGRPEQGSLTEKRGIAAGDSISREIIELCRVISDHGQPNADGKTSITFGDLFDLYIKISNKVVGVLMRARKHGLVDFKGEMLYQRRDEAVVITLLKSVDEIRAKFGGSGDPARCLAESLPA